MSHFVMEWIGSIDVAYSTFTGEGAAQEVGPPLTANRLVAEPPRQLRRPKWTRLTEASGR